MGFKCDHCGDIDCILEEGTEGPIEGVYFEIRHDNGKYEANVCKKDANYFSRLNAKYWLDQVVGITEDPAFFPATCSKCKKMTARPN